MNGCSEPLTGGMKLIVENHGNNWINFVISSVFLPVKITFL